MDFCQGVWNECISCHSCLVFLLVWMIARSLKANYITDLTPCIPFHARWGIRSHSKARSERDTLLYYVHVLCSTVVSRLRCMIEHFCITCAWLHDSLLHDEWRLAKGALCCSLTRLGQASPTLYILKKVSVEKTLMWIESDYEGSEGGFH